MIERYLTFLNLDCARLPKLCAAGRRFGEAGIVELKGKTRRRDDTETL